MKNWKGNMRKIIKSIILTSLLLAVLTVPALAAGTARLSPSSTSLNRGSTFTVTIRLSGAGSFQSGSLMVSCGSGLTLTGISSKVSQVSVSPKLDTGKAVLYSMEPTSVSGEFLALSFQVKGDAAFTDQSIGITLNLDEREVIHATASVRVNCKHSYGGWSKVNSSSHKRTCSICGKSETADHTYDNACDTKCNGCGHTRTITHQYEETWSSDDAVHFHKCAVCGVRKDETAHTPGAEATVAAPQTCTECQHILVPSLEHDHILLSGLQSDATGHWRVCTLCPNRIELAEHRYSAECDEDCDDCGYKRETVHTQGTELEADDEHHWYPCTVCGKHMEEQEHSGDMTEPEPICEICGNAMRHTHDYSKDWAADLEEHWHQCVCGDQEGKEAHTWSEGEIRKYPGLLNNGTVVFSCQVCEAENEAAVPALYRSALSLLILCSVLGAAFLGMLITLIVIIVKVNKKPKGKFAAGRQITAEEE